MSTVLNDLVFMGEQKPLTYNEQTARFYSNQPCPYPISSYLRRICQYSGCSNEVFVFVMVYIDRLVCNGLINLTRTNIHRIIITSTMVAAKFYDDQFYYNPFFATVGGIKAHEINTLEIELLFLLEFNLFVTREEYERYYMTLSNLAVTKGITNDPNLLPRPLPPPNQEEEEVLEIKHHCFFKDTQRNVNQMSLQS